MYQTFDQNGAEYIKTNLENMASRAGSPFHEGILNRIGYSILQSDEPHVEKAIEIFKVNVDLFPHSANVYDSLGEAYYVNGDIKNAMKWYEKTFKIDPEFPSAIKMLREMKG